MRGKTAEDVRLLELLDPVAETCGYAIVRLRLMGGDHQRRDWTHGHGSPERFNRADKPLSLAYIARNIVR